MTTRNLEALLTPRSVALIGASPTPGSVGNIVARNLLRAGFAGPIHFVNPKHPRVEDRVCATSVREIDGVPDLAIVATPPDTVPSIIAELGAKGVRAAVVITAGLTAEQKVAVLNAARPRCLRVQGPNCLGIMLPQIGLDASFSHRAPLSGDLAFLSQSGALVTSIVDWAAARGIGFSHVVSLGEMLDVDFGDLLDYLAGDSPAARSCSTSRTSPMRRSFCQRRGARRGRSRSSSSNPAATPRARKQRCRTRERLLDPTRLMKPLSDEPAFFACAKSSNCSMRPKLSRGSGVSAANV